MKMKSISLQIPVLIVAVLVIAGGSFYGGMVFAKSSTKNGVPSADQVRQFNGASGASGMMARGQQGGRMGGVGGMSTGEVISKTATGFTIKLRDGGSKVVLVASSTSIGKMAAGSLDDISEGTGIVVTGTSNADGSITASTVQIRSASGTQPGFGEPPMGAPQQGGAQEPTPAN